MLARGLAYISTPLGDVCGWSAYYRPIIATLCLGMDGGGPLSNFSNGAIPFIRLRSAQETQQARLASSTWN